MPITPWQKPKPSQAASALIDDGAPSQLGGCEDMYAGLSSSFHEFVDEPSNMNMDMRHPAIISKDLFGADTSGVFAEEDGDIEDEYFGGASNQQEEEEEQE